MLVSLALRETLKVWEKRMDPHFHVSAFCYISNQKHRSALSGPSSQFHRRSEMCWESVRTPCLCDRLREHVRAGRRFEGLGIMARVIERGALGGACRRRVGCAWRNDIAEDYLHSRA